MGIVLYPNQVVALDREREGDEDVVSEDEHVPELLADDIPGSEHLLFVPEVVEDVQTSEKLVGDHPKRKAAQGLSLQGSEAQVQDEPEDHGHPIRHEFDIESSDAGVQLSPDPKVKAEGAVGMAIHEFTSDLPVESSLQIEEGGDQKGDDVDHRPQRPKLLGEGSHSEELDTFQTGEDSSEGENESDGKNGEPKSIDGVGQLRSSLGLRVSFDYVRWKQDRCSTDVSVVEEVGCGC